MFNFGNKRLLILFISMFCFLNWSESNSIGTQLLDPANHLTDLNLLKTVSKWFLLNEIKLLHLSEQDLKKKFFKFIVSKNVPYKNNKALRKAFVYLKNIQKRKQFILKKNNLLTIKKLKSKNVPFKYG